MKYKALVFSVVCFLIFAPVAGAQMSSYQGAAVTSAYRKFKEISSLDIKAPTVVEVPFNDEYIEILSFTIFDQTRNTFEPYLFRQQLVSKDFPLAITSIPAIPGIQATMDGDMRTYSNFPLQSNMQGMIRIVLSGSEAVTSSALTTLLDANVALPNYLQIEAEEDGQPKIVLAKKEMTQNTINFPKTSSKQWIITYWYSQPLRISELKLVQENSLKNILNTVRFLALPGHYYQLFFDPDRYANAPVGETGHLYSAKEVLKLNNLKIQANPAYVIADTDHDGIPDIRDNCVSVSNPDQIDVNNNQLGDMCEDFDFDGISNSEDNCPDDPNWNQKDRDGDGIGDVCDNQESRITEKYPWIPWVGIAFAAIVLVSLFAVTAHSKPDQSPPVS